MQSIKNNVQHSITLLYAILILIITGICGIGLYHVYYHSFMMLENQLNYVEGITIRSTSEMLNHHESIMSIIGHHVFHNFGASDSEIQIQTELEKIIDLNSTIIAIAIVELGGDIRILTESNPNVDKPNLYDVPHARESFARTVNSFGIILGDTYNAPMINFNKGAWVIPMRLRVADEIGSKEDIVVAMGISPHAHIENWGSIGEISGIDIDIIKSNGTIQFSNHEQSLYSKIVINPNKLSELPQHKLSYLHILPGPDRLGVISYDEEFDLYNVITVDHNTLLLLMSDDLIILSILYISVIIIISALYVWITRTTKNYNQALVYQATHDHLTEFPNRYFLMEEVSTRIQSANKHKTSFAVLYIDIDDFKHVNDTYGHDIGDQLLNQIADRFRSAVRQFDFIARIGGDEFVILTEEFESSVGYGKFSSVNRIANRIQLLLKELFTIKDCEDIKIYSNASIGIALYPTSAMTASDLIHRADAAMYKAKHHGKNQIFIYNSEIEEEVKNHYEIGTALHEAIANNILTMVYQPQYDIRTKQMIGIEALVRWKSEEFGFVPPDVFIPIAEQHGLMRELGAYIIDQTIDDFAYLNDICKQSDGSLKKMAINISPLQFNDPNFIHILGEALLTYDVNAKYIEIEITETAVISNEQEIIKVNELIDIGLSVAIDDFGTGYSSLSKLHSLPISTIKIDKAFIQSMLEDEKSESLVTSIIGLGENLGMCIVAEGVETQEQIDFLKTFNHSIIVQGYVYSKPVSITEIIRLCKNSNNK